MNRVPDKILTGTWKNGQVILDGPADWPDGCKLRVAAIPGPIEQTGIPDDQWPRDPQGIAELLERMDQIEPFEMMPEEEADWAEGCRGVVKPEESPEEVFGMTEEEQSDDPEAIARWLAEFDAIPPWQMTDEEEAKWQADRRVVKDYTIARMNERFSEEGL
jgi:hypothetical protein